MQHFDLERVLSVLGLGAASGVIAPTLIYGDFLNTNGFFLLSYAEWFKVVGTFYILCLFTQMFGVTKIIGKLIKYILNKW